MINLLTYSDSNYREKQKMLSERAKSFGINSIEKTREELISTDFYQNHQDILNQPRGSGYWLWKPFFIIKTLQQLNKNDILLYLDSGDWLKKNPVEYLKETMKNKHILLTDGAYKNGEWTKGDCFFLMNCNEEKYKYTKQLEAGIIVIKNTEWAESIMINWLEYSKYSEIITDSPNKFSDNLPGFKDHRHDQSILTNIKIKYDLYSSDDMREFITCNYDK